MKNDKAIELAKKLKAMYEGSDGPESENAKEKLETICSKYGISIDQLEENDKKEWRLKYSGFKGEQLMTQVIVSVLGNVMMWEIKKGGRKQNITIIECTYSEFVEISEKFAFYRDALKKGADLFFSAFVQKNRLFATGEVSSRELTEDDLKVFRLMDSIESNEFFKQLEQ